MTYAQGQRRPDGRFGPPGQAPQPSQPMIQPMIVEIPVERDTPGMARLRGITYTLCSIAAALFIVLVVYGGMKLYQLSSALSGLTGGVGSSPTYQLPAVPTPPALPGR